MVIPLRGAKDFMWALVGRCAAAALQAASIVMLARFSSPSEFGLALGVQGALLTVAFFLGFGFGSYVTVEQAKSPLSEEVRKIVYINQQTSLFSGVICLIILTVVGAMNAQVYWLIPLAVAMAAHRNSAVLEGIALANGRAQLFGVTMVLRRLFLVVLFAVLLFSQVNSLLAYAIAYALSEVFINFFFRRAIGRIPRPAEKRVFRSVLRRSVPYWVETVSVQFRGLDVSAASLAGGTVISGLYAVPSRLSSAILMLPSTFANLCLPRIANGSPRTLVRVMIASVPVILGVFALLATLATFTKTIIVVVLGPEYVDAVLPTQIFCIGFAVLSVITIVNAIAQGIGLAKEVAWSSMLGAVLVVVFVGVGAGTLGAEGSSWGYSAAVLVQLIALCAMSTGSIGRYLRS
jgi:O-antigen/teichoic acid export membrane protein